MNKQYTRENAPKWCKLCKKTKRGIPVDDCFMCVDCATEAGYTVIKRSNASSTSFTSKTGRKARKKQLKDKVAHQKTIEAIKAKASKAAKLREEKKRQKRKIALMEGMVGIDGLANHFKKSGICRGCNGRLPVAQAVYVHRDDFRNPNDTPTVVCRGCIE